MDNLGEGPQWGVLKALGVLAGEDLPLESLKRWADTADWVVAADSGADRLLACGGRIDLLVGDLDSVSPQGERSAGEVLRIEEQDTTDCDKLLRTAAARGVKALTLTSVEGSQPDHELATLHSAARAEIEVRLAFRRGIGRIAKAGQTVIATHPGERISLMPLTVCSGVTLSGVEWSLIDVELALGGLCSVSNVASGRRVEVRMAGGLALLYRECGPHPDWE